MPNDSDVDRFFDVVHHQRACRAFTGVDVDEGLVEKLLEAATHAPSAENRQPWVFVVVRRPDLRAEIGRIYEQAWESGARSHSEGRLPPKLLEDVEAGARGGIVSAPVLVVVCGDAGASPARTLPSSVFPAVQNLLLAAGAVGLGSALTTLAIASGDAVSDLLGLPDDIRPMAVVPVGWPAKPAGPPRRARVSEKTYRERYGEPW